MSYYLFLDLVDYKIYIISYFFGMVTHENYFGSDHKSFFRAHRHLTRL